MSNKRRGRRRAALRSNGANNRGDGVPAALTTSRAGPSGSHSQSPEWPTADRLFQYHLNAFGFALAAMIVAIEKGKTSPLGNPFKWLCISLVGLGMLMNFVPNGLTLRPFSLGRTGDIPAYVRHLKRRLAVDSLIFALSLAGLVHFLRLDQAIVQSLPPVGVAWQKTLAGLATLSGWVLSGLVGNASYSYLRKKIETAPWLVPSSKRLKPPTKESSTKRSNERARLG